MVFKKGHKGYNIEKRMKTIIEKYGKFIGRPKGMKHTEETKQILKEKSIQYFKTHRHPNDKRIKIKCLFCKNEFIGHENRKFCSVKCASKWNWQQEDYIKKNKNKHLGHIGYNKSIEKRKCIYCDNIFEVTKNSLQKYCSQHCFGLGIKGKLISEVTRKKLKLKSLDSWQNLEVREKQIKAILKGLMKRPTSYEKIIINLITKYNLPYKYVGDGSFLIGYKNPDFVNVNGEKICIEVYNNYHHPKDYEEIRGEYFKKYGWRTIFINEDEINNQDIILEELNNEKK